MYIFAAFSLVIVMIFLIWGLISRRKSIPCPVWLRWMVELDNPFTRTNRAAEILLHLDLEPGMCVLDAGCGPGRLTLPLARAVGAQGRVVAMDIQSGMLERTRQRAQKALLNNITYLQGGLGEGNVPEAQFDRALLVTVLGEIPDRESALKEIFSALKPAGVLSVTEVIFDPHFQRRATVSRLAVAAGFSERAFYGNSIAYTIHFVKG